MSSEKDSILEFNQYMKSDKMPSIIYADIESLITKIDRCANNPKNSSTAKMFEHIPFGYSMPKIWTIDHIEKRHFISWEDCMKNFSESLREHTKEIFDFEKKKMHANNKKYQKVIDHFHYTGKYKDATHSICNLKFNLLNEISVVFHNGSSYDYHFIIK